ncbi:hypothetical protein [Streptomyces sp. NBC_00009]|uniref:hypothetical protein n=1 Tax=Streptomyces sp. NBC_00009 TaxID=2975620 RepID=UPI00386CEB4E
MGTGFTTDAHGAGAATARQGWEFRPGEARSVVLHGMPGGAGARIACFTVPFEPAAVERVPVERAPVETMPFERVSVEPVTVEVPVHRGR